MANIKHATWLCLAGWMGLLSPALALFDSGNGVQVRQRNLGLQPVVNVASNLVPFSAIKPVLLSTGGSSKFAGGMGALMNLSLPVPTGLPANPTPSSNPEYYSLTNGVELSTNAILDELVRDYQTNALALYGYVLNHVDFRAAPATNNYSIKGALGCYLEREGNDTDLCSLTIYLLRRCNIPCAYGYLPNAQISPINWKQIYGYDLVDTSLTGYYGCNGSPTNAATNTIVYAYLSTTNSAVTNWVGLVPWWKQRQFTEGMEFRDCLTNSFTASQGVTNGLGILDSYLRKSSSLIESAINNTSDLAMDFLPSMMNTLLATNSPTTSSDQVGVQWQLAEQDVSQWPINYDIQLLASNGVPTASAVLPGSQRATVTFKLLNKSGVMLSNTVTTVELHNRRVLVYFQPATMSDWNKTTNGFYAAGTNLNVVGMLSLGSTAAFAQNIVTGSVATKMSLGSTVTNWIDSGSRIFNAGNYECYAFNFGRVTPEMLDQHYQVLQTLSLATKAAGASLTWTNVNTQLLLGEQLCSVGMNYYMLLDQSSDQLEGWTKVRVLGKDHVGAFYFGLSLTNSSGMGLADTMSIDAFNLLINPPVYLHDGATNRQPYRVTEPFAQERDWFQLYGLSMSTLEHGILQKCVGFTNAMSSDRDLRAALAIGGRVSNMTAATFSNSQNATLISNVDASAYAKLQSFFATNSHPQGAIWFPSKQVTNGTYHGYGWLQVDVNTNTMTNWALGFLISGGNHGGDTTSYAQPAIDALAKASYTPDYVPAPLTLLTPTPTAAGLSIDFAGQNANNLFTSDALSLGVSIGGAFGAQASQGTLNQIVAGYGQAVGGPGAISPRATWNQTANFYGIAPSTATGDTVVSADLYILQVQNANGFYGGSAPAQALLAKAAAIFDPVDARTGDFYVDECDMVVAGLPAIAIRRAYSSRYEAAGEFGFGWRFNHSCYLAIGMTNTQIRAVEPDGSVLCYQQTNAYTWVVTPALNPTLANQNASGIGGTANPFANRIDELLVGGTTNYIAATADGQRRTYSFMSFIGNSFTNARPYLTRWEDANSNALTYVYGTDASRGDFARIAEIHNATQWVKLKYNSAGLLTEIRASDGRVTDYDYNSAGDLSMVQRADDTFVFYDYHQNSVTSSNGPQQVSSHLISRETKPGGRVLENDYDGYRRVTAQRATVGVTATPVPNATFNYQGDGTNGYTLVQNILGATTRYDYANGLICKITDALGNVESNQWDAAHNLLAHMDKRGVLTQYAYDERGNATNISVVGDITGSGTPTTATTANTYTTNNLLSATVNPRGVRTGLNYDAHWNLTTQELYAANGTLYRRDVCLYNSLGLLTGKTEALGAVDAATYIFTYDTDGNLTQSSLGGISTRNFQHDACGWVTRATDATGANTDFTYDAMGRVLTKTGYVAAGPVQKIFTYDESGNQVAEAGPRPINYIARTYDRMNRLLTASVNHYSASSYPPVSAGVATTQYAYDGFGNLIAVTDPNGNVTSYGYDAVGRRIASTNFAGNTSTVLAAWQFSYDGGGLLTSTRTPRGYTESTAYTALGKPKLKTHADGSTEQWTYDLTGLVMQYTDPRQVVTQFQYDDFGHLLSRNEAVGTAVQRSFAFTYDQHGRQLTVTDPQTLVTTYTYDVAGRVITVAGPSGASQQSLISNSYDGEGRLLASSGAATSVANTYDALGRLTFKTWGSGPDYIESYAFDITGDPGCCRAVYQGNQEGVIDFLDEAGRLGTRVFVDGHNQQFQYDFNGNVTSQADELGQTTTFTYDGLNRLASSVAPDNQSISYQYDADGNCLNSVYPQNLRHVRGFDPMGRTTAEQVLSNTGGAMLNNSFTYDSGGNVTVQTSARGVTINSVYDALGRRTSLSAAASSALIPPVSLAFSYTANGWLQAASGGAGSISRTLDQNGRILTENNSVTVGSYTASSLLFSQTFDADGRRQALTAPFSCSYQWDGASRLINASCGVNFTWQYDSLGHLGGLNGYAQMTNIWANRNYLQERYSLASGTLLFDEWNSTNPRANLQMQNVATWRYWDQTSRPSSFSYDTLNQLSVETDDLGTSVGVITNTFAYDTTSMRTNIIHGETVLPWQRAGVPDNFHRLVQEKQSALGGNPVLTISGQILNSSNVVVQTNGVFAGTAAVDAVTHIWALSNIPLPAGTNTILAIAEPAQVWAATNKSTVTVNLNVTGSYAYDAEGNVVWMNRGGKNYSLVWDALGRLSAVTIRDGAGNGTNWFANYDALGRRVGVGWQNVSTNQALGSLNATFGVVDPENPLAELLHQDIGNSQTNFFAFIYGPDQSGALHGAGGIGGLVGCSDAQGYIWQALNDLRGNVAGFFCPQPPYFINTLAYTAFGPATAPTNDAPSFATRWLDPTGFYYFGGRYYDAATGRFLSPDPSRFADSRNLYAFCGNDPVNNCDPDGMLEAQLARETRKQNTRGSKLWDLEFGGDADVQFDAAMDLVASVAMLAIDIPAVGGLGEIKAGSTMARMGAGVESGLSAANLAREYGTASSALGAEARIASGTARSEGIIYARVNSGRAPFSELNGAITEERGWQQALQAGETPIRAPKPASIQGPDYITFSPEAESVIVTDAKYRAPGRSYPSSIPAQTLQRWLPQVRAAVEAMPPCPARDAAMEALQRGAVQGRIFKGP